MVSSLPTHRLLSTTRHYAHPLASPSAPYLQQRALTGAVLALGQTQARSLSVGSFVRPLLRSLRFPLAGLGVGAGAVGAASYTLEEWGNKAHALGMDLRRGAAELFDSAAKEWNAFEMPTIEVPDFFTNLANGIRDNANKLGETLRQKSEQFANSAKKSDEEGGNEGGSPRGGGSGPASVLAAAVAAISQDDNKDTKTTSPPDNQLMILTKKLIEIRNILLSIDHNESLKLPSIVVIGSQSSGKSSVLEAIVGHEFLPKGNNMVTRRPIELTLVNTAEGTQDYGEFPGMGLGKIKDFKQIQKNLFDMNMAVPDEEAVSEKPIELRIYSPNVPDLSLVDLPGYIQIETIDQPEMLKSKIQDLCEKYIRAPNIILAVCAADVDLANSPALRASRRADSLGLRTIGVVTKMDLVDADQGIRILKNRQYPLHLGYVGVVCKAPKSASSDALTTAVVKHERDYFGQHPQYQSGVNVGTMVLRDRLMRVLEDSMAQSLHGITNDVQLELEKAAYDFKVRYNDRSITAESYVAETMDGLKLRFKEFTSSFGKPEVRRILKQTLDQQWLNIMLEQYWSQDDLATLPKATPDDPRWQAKFDFATSSLTKSGIGRGTTAAVVKILYDAVDHLTEGDPYNFHPEAKEKMIEFTNDILRKKVHITQEQVENCIKPFKHEIEMTDAEWEAGVKQGIETLEWELKTCNDALTAMKKQIGSSKLNTAMRFLADQEVLAEKRRKEIKSGVAYSEDIDDATKPAYHPKLLDTAQQALLYRDRATILKMRVAALKSRQCKSLDNKMYCPEAFLNVVSQKLIYTAVMFINIELLSEFFYQFPRELDNHLVYDLNREEIANFARQNPAVRAHLEAQSKKEKLELVMEKLNSLVHLQSEQDGSSRRNKFLGLF